MLRKALIFAAMVGLGSFGSQVQAAWPNLNPFSQGTKSRATNSWWPSSTATAKPSGPSTFTKISNGTKSMMKKTGEALNPWSKPANETPQQTLRNSLQNRTASNKKAESSSWWSPWAQEEEPARPRTVGEFLKQDRPGFGDR